METLINVIEVDPARQQDVVALLQEGTEAAHRHRPGFISAGCVLASNDGTRVVNHAEWRDLERTNQSDALADPAVQFLVAPARPAGHRVAVTSTGWS